MFTCVKHTHTHTIHPSHHKKKILTKHYIKHKNYQSMTGTLNKNKLKGMKI